jgi:hypothetical protein
MLRASGLIKKVEWMENNTFIHRYDRRGVHSFADKFRRSTIHDRTLCVILRNNLNCFSKTSFNEALSAPQSVMKRPTDWTSGVQLPPGRWYFLFDIMSRPTLKPTQSLCEDRMLVALSSEAKVAEDYKYTDINLVPRLK